ncbi:MAG: hypothetical protein JWO67_4020, partial [Streptosporangiaceae bacterium]|nr:hypothetical protein [Streptosporangiaceae bacterium]
ETAQEVPEPIRAIARRAFAGRPPDAEGVFSLLSDRDPWRALDAVLAAVLPAHEAMVRAKVAEEIFARRNALEIHSADDKILRSGMWLGARIALGEQP